MTREYKEPLFSRESEVSVLSIAWRAFQPDATICRFRLIRESSFFS